MLKENALDCSGAFFVSGQGLCPSAPRAHSPQDIFRQKKSEACCVFLVLNTQIEALAGLERGDDGGEIRGLQAGAPHKCAVDIGNGKDFSRIGGFHRAAVE